MVISLLGILELLILSDQLGVEDELFFLLALNLLIQLSAFPLLLLLLLEAFLIQADSNVQLVLIVSKMLG